MQLNMVMRINFVQNVCMHTSVFAKSPGKLAVLESNALWIYIASIVVNSLVGKHATIVCATEACIATQESILSEAIVYLRYKKD